MTLSLLLSFIIASNGFIQSVEVFDATKLSLCVPNRCVRIEKTLYRDFHNDIMARAPKGQLNYREATAWFSLVKQEAAKNVIIISNTNSQNIIQKISDVLVKRRIKDFEI